MTLTINTKNNFISVPEVIRAKILNYLDAKTSIIAAKTCQQFRSTINDNLQSELRSLVFFTCNSLQIKDRVQRVPEDRSVRRLGN